MGILTNATKLLIEGGFDLLGNYIDRKRQEGQDKKAFKLLFEHLAKQPGWSQGGILPLYDMLSSQQSGKSGVLPLDSNINSPDTGLQNNWSEQRRRPIIDYETGEMYWPVLGSGNYYQDSKGNLVQP